MTIGGYQPEGKDCTIIMLMDWRHEKEQQGNKIAARAIQRLIDKLVANKDISIKATEAYWLGKLHERKTGIKLNGW
jgi:hypothetical protein